MDHISSHIVDLLRYNNPDNHWKFQLISKWHEIMGPLADKVTVQKIYQNSLILGVIDSCWMQEMHLLSHLIKDKINANLQSNRITSIKFRCNSSIEQKSKSHKPKNEQTLEPRALRTQEIKALAQITDQELAKALQGFLEKCHQFC